jgi:hypothetical protein
MAPNGEFSPLLNTQETSSVVTEQRDIHGDSRDALQAAAAIPATSSWRQWYLAFKSILPIYVAVHVAFFITTVFSVLFILPDFSTRSMPLITLGQAWDRWDTKGYLAIAMHGYDSRPKIAFFPLYSLMIKCVMLLIHNPLLAGAIVSNLAGLVLLVVFYQLVAEDFDAKRAYRTVLYLSLFPTAFFLAAAYTESLFLCLSVLTFYFLRHGRWWLAGIFGFFACLTRSAGILLLLPFFYEYLRQHHFSIKTFRFGILSSLLLPAALGLFALYCYFRFHDPLAFAHAPQVFWGRQLHVPGYGMVLSLKSILHSPGILSFQALRNFIDLGAGIFIFLLIALSFFGSWKIPRHLWAYTIYAVALYLFLQLYPLNNPFPLESNARYMLEVFPAFVVLAGLGKNRMLNMNYLLASGTLLFFLLTQFLTGHWIT